MKKNTRTGTQTAKFEPNRKVNPVGIIDSINIKSKLLIPILNNHEDILVESVKIGKKANPKRWIAEFGKSLYNKTRTGRWAPFEAHIVHGVRGVSMPLKVFKNKYGITEILQFAGLHKYTDEALQRKLTLSDLWSTIQYCEVSRVDIAIDLTNQQQIDDIKKGLKHVGRHKDVYKNTTYYKTAKQIKKRAVVNILSYDKGTKENWNEKQKITRFEFQFSSEFFTKMQVKDFDKAIKKMENRILRDTGIKIKILPISPKLIPKSDSDDHEFKSVLKYITARADTILTFIKKESQKLSSMLNQITKLLSQIQTDLHIISNDMKLRGNRSNIQSRFLPTKDMAKYLTTSPSFLEKNMKSIFKKGVHYSKPHDARLLRWDVEVMHKWIKGEEQNETDKQLLSKLFD